MTREIFIMEKSHWALSKDPEEEEIENKHTVCSGEGALSPSVSSAALAMHVLLLEVRSSPQFSS